MSYETLERNLALLLQRSYVPARPTPHFEDRLRARFLAELRPRARRTRAPRLAFALVAAVLLALLALRIFAPDAPPTRAGLLAEGAVALELDPGAWRAADARELATGHAFAGPHLTVVTPEERGFLVQAAGGTLTLAPASELRLEGEPRLAALLVRGVASFARADEARALVPGTRLWLADPGTPDTTSRAAPRTGREDAGATPVAPDLAAPRVLRGRVTVAADGASVPAFTLGLLRERVGNATYPPETRTCTDAEGRFTWPDPPRGKQRVFVHAAGFALAALGELDFDAPLAELDVRLEPGVTISGRVLDTAGEPVAGALVLAEDETPTDGLFFDGAEDVYWLPIRARTDRDGFFELEHVGPGVHTLRASADGYAPSWQPGASSAQEFELVLHRGGTLEGRVTGADGGPWSGAELVVVAMTQPVLPRTNFALTRTDLDGRYRLEHLPPMTMIAVLIRGDRPDVRPLQMLEDATVRADFDTPLAGITLRGTMSGRDGHPLVRQNLGLFDRRSATWNRDWIASSTDGAGRYVFEGLRPGQYLVFLIDELGRGLRCVDELTLGEELRLVEHDLRVPECEFTVTLRSRLDGAPVAAVALVLERLEQGHEPLFVGLGVSDARGTFRFVEQRPGTYRVIAYPSDGRHGFVLGESVELGPVPATQTLALGRGGSVRVQVRARDGRPLARAIVLFADPDGLEHSFSRTPETDADGRFHADGLVAARYSVRVHADGYQDAETTLDFDPDEEALVPFVLDPLPVTPR